MSNYVELCRIVEYRRTRRTLSNYVELVELCRIMSNFVNLVGFKNFFVKFSLFFCLCLIVKLHRTLLNFLKVIQVYPALTMILAGPNFVWGSSVPPPLHTMYACPIELTSSPLIQ